MAIVDDAIPEMPQNGISRPLRSGKGIPGNIPNQRGMDTKAIDRTMGRLMKAAGAPGASLAIVQGGDVYTKGYGVKSLVTGEGVTTETLFANASTTKALTATGIALLVDEGKMAWDDPVRKWLPNFRLADPHADALVTVRDLLCHRTGLPRHDMLWYHSAYNRAEILRRIGSAKLTATFRGAYQYQNICYTAAGECARAASGAESWEAFMRERLLGPLGMHRSCLSANLAQLDENHATPHQWLKGKVVPSEWLNFDNAGPCGTLNSSATEMVGWLRFLLAGGVTPEGTRLLSEKTLRETWVPHIPTPIDDDTRAKYPFVVQSSYCLGWTLQNYRNGLPVLNHGGAIDGFRAHVLMVPTERIALAVFTNVGRPLVEQARYAVLDILLGLEPMDWLAVQKTELAKIEQDQKDAEKKRKDQRKTRLPHPLPLSAYVGEFDDPAYGAVTVTLEEKRLCLKWNGWSSPLKHHTYQTFLTDTENSNWQNREARFRANATGEVISLQLMDGEFVKKSKPKVTAGGA